MSKVLNFPPVANRSINEPSVLLSQEELARIFRSRMASQQVFGETEIDWSVARQWLKMEAQNEGWHHVEWHGNQCLLIACVTTISADLPTSQESSRSNLPQFAYQIVRPVPEWCRFQLATGTMVYSLSDETKVSKGPREIATIIVTTDGYNSFGLPLNILVRKKDADVGAPSLKISS